MSTDHREQTRDEVRDPDCRTKNGERFRFKEFVLTQVIAMSGKGGTGKTTLAALIIRYLKRKGVGPVLAVDADPNANLAEALGLMGKKSLGTTREDFFESKMKLPPGMPKEVIDIIANGAAKAVRDPKFQAIVEKQGVSLDPMSGPDFYRWTASEYDRAKKLLAQAGELAK